MVRAQGVDRRQALLAHEIEGAGQQCCDRARCRHRVQAGVAGIFDMVGGERFELCGEAGAAEIGKLVGVELDRQAARSGGSEDALGLFGGEADALAKGIHRVGQACVGDGGEHLVDNFPNIVVGTAAGRKGVRA